MARMLPGEAELSWCRNEQVCQGAKSVKRFERSNDLDTALDIKTSMWHLVTCAGCVSCNWPQDDREIPREVFIGAPSMTHSLTLVTNDETRQQNARQM